MSANWPITIIRLLLAAAAAMAGWEIFSKAVAPLIMGGPLSPNGLIVALVKNLAGFKLPGYAATLLHWITGLVLYPIGFFILYTLVPRIGVIGHGLIIGAGTWFLALGVFAPAAGMAFMLKFGTITWVSLWGHIAYGLLLASMFALQNTAEDWSERWARA